MAVDFGKLNKPGLGASSFGTRRTTGTSAQATRNLANSSVATKSSLFSFKGASRTNFVPGRNVSQNMHKYNYQGMRAALNSGAGRTYAPSHAGHVHGPNMGNIGTVTYNNQDLQKGFVIGQAIVGGIGLLNQLGAFDGISGGVKSSSLGDKLSSAFSNIGGGGSVGSAIAGTLSSMESASDSASLRSAIAEANGQLEALNSQTATLQSAAKKATDDVKRLEGEKTTKGKELKQAEQDYKTADNQVKVRKDDRDRKKSALENANAKYYEASQAHTQAKADTVAKQTAFNQAVATLAATPEYIDGPDGTKVKNDPAHANALEAKKAAEEALNTARENEEKAAKAEVSAKEAASNADATFKQAATEYDQAEANLEKAEKNKEQKKAAKEKIEQELEQIKEDINAANGVIEKYENHTEDVKDLQNAISKQQKRLEKMVEDENSEYTKLTNKINSSNENGDERAAKINPDDGMSLTERIRLNRNERANRKNEERLEDKAELSPLVADNQYIQNMLKGKASAVVNGENYYTGTTPSGQTVYYRGNSPITEEMYKAATGTSM